MQLHVHALARHACTCTVHVQLYMHIPVHVLNEYTCTLLYNYVIWNGLIWRVLMLYCLSFQGSIVTVACLLQLHNFQWTQSQCSLQYSMYRDHTWQYCRVQACMYNYEKQGDTVHMHCVCAPFSYHAPFSWHNHACTCTCVHTGTKKWILKMP